MSKSNGDLSPKRAKQTLQRAFAFLRAVGTCAYVRRQLLDVGYSAEEHDRGWRLFEACMGRNPRFDLPAIAGPKADARLEVERWYRAAIARWAVGLRLRFPEQASELLANIAGARGLATMVAAPVLLERVAGLDASTHPDDRAAMAFLATRGLTPAERARAAALVQWVQHYEPGPRLELEEDGADPEKLRALRVWYDDWAHVARTAVTRGDHRVRLGLAQRKQRAAPPNHGPAARGV